MPYYLQERYINLLTDFGFKRVFGTEPNKSIFLDLLNTLLPAYQHIQKLVNGNIEKIDNVPDVLNDIFSLHFIYIELPKFKKTIDQLESHLDKWLYLLRHLPELKETPEPLQEDIFSQLFEVAKIANFSSTEQDSYHNSLKYFRDMNNVVDTSRQEGREEGREEERTVFRSLILRQLSRRLGDLPVEIQQQVAPLSGQALEALGEALFDFSRLDDFTSWLQKNKL
jgi:PD-(D/E)XK nuclease family transposase/Domain of unknown function (DUF4351)